MIRKMKELENKEALHLGLKYNLVEKVIRDSYLNTFVSNRKGKRQHNLYQSQLVVIVNGSNFLLQLEILMENMYFERKYIQWLGM